MTEGPRNKAERLAVAGAIAASVRVTSERDMSRRVALIDEDGNVTGYTTVAEVKRSMLERAKIEIAVTDGVRPKTIVCGSCGKIVRVAKIGPVPKTCKVCTYERKCSDCDAEVAPLTNAPSRIAARGGRLARCRKCTAAALASAVRAKQPDPTCATCGCVLRRGCMAPLQVARRKGRPPQCKTCQFARAAETGHALRAKEQATCADCGVAIRRSANAPSQLKRRADGRARCKPCGYRFRSERKAAS